MLKNNTDNCFVSILMTAYNREMLIKDAIESVLASTYQNWELIICDDCSSDATFQIASGYALNNPRIRVFKNEKNLGDYPNRNHAALLAKGEFIIYVDSDDKILPDGIAQLVQCMLLYPDASFGMYSTLRVAPFELKSTEAIRQHFFQQPFLMMGPGGTINRRSFFNEIKGYPVKYGPANDSYYNLKACSYSSIVIMPFEFMYYRRHEGQEINNFYSYLYNSYRYQRDALNELNLPLSKKEEEWLHRKNKRRFVVNISKYLFNTFNISKTYTAIKLAEFSFRDFIQGVFH